MTHTEVCFRQIHYPAGACSCYRVRILQNRRAAAIAAAVSVTAIGTAIAFGAGPSRNTTRPPLRIGCSSSVYQTPAAAPPKAYAALTLGPAVFNHLAPLDAATPPDRRLPFYKTMNVLNVLAAARHGIEVSITGKNMDAALWYVTGGRQVSWLKAISAGRMTLRDLPRVVTFSVCKDPASGAVVNTQYIGGIDFDRPGCVTLIVREIGTRHSFKRTVPLQVPRC